MESSSSSRPMTSKEAANQDLSEENGEKPEHKNEEEKKEKKKRVKKITATDTFKCNLCPFMTGYLGMFERHVARHAEKKTEYKCAYCDKKFRDQLALNNHSNTHLGLKPYKCDLCESAFGSKSEADRHMRYRHTHEKPHKCPECSYSTVEKTKLKRHMRVHTKERPYICGFCEYASSDTFRLKRHMRIHTGEKPYECPHCKQSFAQCNTLKSHIKNHHSSDGEESKARKYKRRKRRDGGEPRRSKRLKTDAVIESDSEGEQEQDRDIKLNNPAFVMVKEDEEQASEESLEFFKCTECYMKFLTKELFDEHYVKHTGERPYECEICKLKFGHKSALQAHKRSHDPDYYPVRLKQTKTRKKAVSDERDKENRETSTKEEKIEAESDEARESMRKCAPRSQSPLSRLMRVGADEEYQQCGETTIVNATFHVTGSPHRLFLLNAAQSSESSLECHVNTSSILFG